MGLFNLDGSPIRHTGPLYFGFEKDLLRKSEASSSEIIYFLEPFPKPGWFWEGFFCQYFLNCKIIISRTFSLKT
jgi:hypothetical protein